MKSLVYILRNVSRNKMRTLLTVLSVGFCLALLTVLQGYMVMRNAWTKEAAKNIGALVLIPYVAIPAAIFGKLWESVDDKDAYGGGCANLQRDKAEAAAKAGDVKPQDASWYE